MSLNLRESRNRQRRERRARVVKWLVLFGMLGAFGYVAYAAGTDLARRDVIRLQSEVATLSTQVATLEEERARLETEAHEARLQEQQWRQTYERDVPTGPSKALFGLLQDRLVEGVRPERLELAIGAAVNEPPCDNDPVTRRFIVRTPLYRGPNDVVSFADNTITVTAEGQSGQGAGGSPHAWFDPAEAITVAFTVLGGEKTEVSGVLPLHHSVMAGGAEHRFSIVAGDSRGFLHVTGDRCRPS